MIMTQCVQQAAYLSLTAVINHVDSCVPLGLINCPFALCIAVGRTVCWLWPGLLSLVRPRWFGNGLHMTYVGKFWIFSPLWGAMVLVKVLTLSYTSYGKTFCVGVGCCALKLCYMCSLTFGSSVKFWSRIEFTYWLSPQCCLSEAV